MKLPAHEASSKRPDQKDDTTESMFGFLACRGDRTRDF